MSSVNLKNLSIQELKKLVKDKNNCYIKIVREDYYCDSDEKSFLRIHLVFRSKKNYKKNKRY